MSEFNGILESLIADGEQIVTEGASSDTLKNTAMGVAVAAILAGGVVSEIHKRKNDKALKDMHKVELVNKHATTIARNNYYDSQEWVSDSSYINKKYGVTITENGLNHDDYQIFQKKVNQLILQDLRKMASKFNSNKKLCNELADKYIEHECNGDESYKKIATNEAKDIHSGPADVEHYNENDFVVCNCDQSIILFMVPYIQKPFCAALNKKYEKEIRGGAMGGFDITGDGDEGLIGWY